MPGYVSFVPIDFTYESLEARLPECGYSECQKSLFIWEGVTMYLDAASVDRTLAFVASHSAPGSAIVFDYLCEELAPPPKRDFVNLLVSIFRSYSKELRNFAIGEEQIEAFLEARGFHQVSNVSGADLCVRYFSGKNVGRKVTSSYAIAIGIV